MKLNGILLVAVLAGSVAAVGCKSKGQAVTDTQGAVPAASLTAGAELAPEENIATAPVEDSKAPAIEKDRRSFHYYAPHGPPAMRREVLGVAPSARHFWAPGYYRWSGREHTWYDGRWVERRDGYDYVSPRWAYNYNRWEYLPGRWSRRY